MYLKKYKKTILIETFVHIFLQDILLPTGSTKIVNIHYGWASTLFNYILQSILI